MSIKRLTKSVGLEKPCVELTTYAGVCLTEFMRLIYFSRLDIQNRFKLDSVFNRTVLLAWFHMYAKDAVKISPWSWPKVDWNLLHTPCIEIEQSSMHRLNRMQVATWLASSFAKEDIDLSKPDDQLRVEAIIAACADKPEKVVSLIPSKVALRFAGDVDRRFRNKNEFCTLPIPVCNFFSSIWAVRKDIQNVFSSHKLESCAALVLWFLNHGRKELDLSSIKIPALDQRYLLEASPCLIDSGAAIPRVLHEIWCSSYEMQSVYDIQAEDGKQSLLDWFKERGVCEYGLEWLFADSVSLVEKADRPVSKSGLDMRSADRSAAPELQFGINVIGNAQGAFGMSQHAIMTALAVQAVDVPCALVDLHSQAPAEQGEAFKFGCNVARGCSYNINIAAFVPGMLAHEFAAVGLKHLDASYNIFYGNWEYKQFPYGHAAVIESFDEAWGTSAFTVNALESAVSKPVSHVPLCVKLPEIRSYARDYFNLPPRSFLFLHTFDFHAGILRKNPIACVRAFMEAFPESNKSVCLVIKAKSVHDSIKEDYQEWLKLLELAESDRRIIVMDKKLDRHEMTGLVNLADAFISLHRAEGFGFAIAEAMLLAKPVIATNYSGSTDFTLLNNSCPVDYQLIALPEIMRNRLGVEAHWAEADISQAAWHMRRLVSDEKYGSGIGRNAKDLISTKYSPAAVGAIIKERLSGLG